MGADLSLRCKWTQMTALHYAAYFDVAPVITHLLMKSKVNRKLLWDRFSLPFFLIQNLSGVKSFQRFDNQAEFGASFFFAGTTLDTHRET